MNMQWCATIEAFTPWLNLTNANPDKKQMNLFRTHQAKEDPIKEWLYVHFERSLSYSTGNIWQLIGKGKKQLSKFKYKQTHSA